MAEMDTETFKVGDPVEIIRGNTSSPMPHGLTIGSRGTVVDATSSCVVLVDYGLKSTVFSDCDTLRKVPKEIEHV